VTFVKQTTVQLSDGRELYLYDSSDSVVRQVLDTRPLATRAFRGEMRFDLLHDEWVTIAGHRQTRTQLPNAVDCPLCPSRPGKATEIPADDYEVAVFENRFPSFEGAPVDAHFASVSGSLYRTEPAIGRCEVISFTSDHEARFVDLAPLRVRMILDVWVQRTRELSGLPGVKQVFCFENHGEEIGVTLHHSHGQIYAYPFIAPLMQRMINNAERYREMHGSSLFAEILETELRDIRVVSENATWVAFVPGGALALRDAPRSPRRPINDLTGVFGLERHTYPRGTRLRSALTGTSCTCTCGFHHPSRRRQASILRIESAMGAFINDIGPELAARSLRNAL
jgi:UDPglucose--hexose-1-phosphate uridylyltransferase